MDNAKKHYSSLFVMPSYKRALLSTAAICILGTTLTAYALFPNPRSLALGISLFAVSLLADLSMNRLLLRGEPIFTPRRTAGMSTYCWLLWLAFMALGTTLGYFFGWLLWVKLTLLGFAAVLTLRALVISATSDSARWRQIISILLQPLLSIVVLLAFWATVLGNLSMPFLPFIILAPIISYAAVYLFLHTIDRLGQSTYGLPSMPLFKAFLLNWATDLNAPLETYLEVLGKDADIDVTLLKFNTTKPQAAIIVPQVHPGPFKNIGSSLLPSMLKSSFEEKYGCATCTPLGILGHEQDLASQGANQKIVTAVLESAKFVTPFSLASPFTRTTDGPAIANCQIFGDTAFISFTLAPKTTEDLPQDLGRIVAEETKKVGLKHAVVVNCHNSIDAVDDTVEHVDALKRAAVNCLQKAVALPTKPFRVGAATVFPKEFTLKQGMGTGGITAIAVEADNQRNVYIVIDGNNMIPHLREKIIHSLSSLGYVESEVFTTDTHAVSALVRTSRGYYPVGEVMDHDLLQSYISEAAKKAITNLEVAQAGCVQFTVPQVRVIGEERLRSVTTLVDKAIRQAKTTAPAIFGAEGLLLILLLLLF